MCGEGLGLAVCGEDLGLAVCGEDLGLALCLGLRASVIYDIQCFQKSAFM